MTDMTEFILVILWVVFSVVSLSFVINHGRQIKIMRQMWDEVAEEVREALRENLKEAQRETRGWKEGEK